MLVRAGETATGGTKDGQYHNSCFMLARRVQHRSTFIEF